MDKKWEERKMKRMNNIYQRRKLEDRGIEKEEIKQE